MVIPVFYWKLVPKMENKEVIIDRSVIIQKGNQIPLLLRLGAVAEGAKGLSQCLHRTYLVTAIRGGKAHL